MAYETDTDREYPTWRVIFQDDKYANLRCAVKYLFWMIAHVPLALIGIVAYIGITLLTLPTKLLPHDARSWCGTQLDRILRSNLTKKAGRALSVLFVGGFMVGVTVMILYSLYMNPLFTIGVVGLAIGILVLLSGATIVGGAIKRKILRPAGKKAAETKAVRRIYGNCPVSMDVSPKWFDTLMAKLTERLR